MNSSILPTSSEDGLFEYLPVTSDTLEGSLNVIRTSFFREENVSRALGVSKNPDAIKELEELSVRNAKDGISLIAVEKSTGFIVGVLFNKLQVNSNGGDNYFEEFAAKCKSPNSKALVEFMIKVDADVNLFELCQVDCLLEMVFLSVLPAYRNRGIGFKLCELSIEIGRALFNGYNAKTPIGKDEVLSLGPVPKGVYALFTSKTSQHLGRKLNLCVAVEISYEKCNFEGETFANRLGPDNPSTTVEYIKF